MPAIVMASSVIVSPPIVTASKSPHTCVLVCRALDLFFVALLLLPSLVRRTMDFFTFIVGLFTTREDQLAKVGFYLCASLVANLCLRARLSVYASSKYLNARYEYLFQYGVGATSS
mmetsp:Transcript_12303/g.36132  ORF Transcript_12303/g.36132 Transcript_12303/m.36132 type:complete len:116 (-) Transcript_12303:28-375(-)